MAEIHRLRLYADDGTTVAAEFTTDPAGTRPHLIVPDSWTSQEVDFAKGSAKIGVSRLEIVDVPTDPTDQDTGFLTSILPSASGHTARIARRAHWEVSSDGITFRNVMNGVLDDLELNDDFCSYGLSIKDQREYERRTRAFTVATTASVLPRGVIAGWGLGADGTSYLVPPTTPLVATYGSFDAGLGFTVGVLMFPTPGKVNGKYAPPVDQIVTAKMMEQFRVEQSADGGLRHSRIRLHWRAAGTADPWNIIEYPLWRFGWPGGWINGIWVDHDRETEVLWIDTFSWFTDSQPHPAVDQSVDVVFGYGGVPTEEYPLHLEDTFGGTLAALLDGDYSEAASAVASYDAAAVAALTEPLLARITEPLDDEDGIWKWNEANIYAPLGAAPALDEDGLISPVRYQLPDPTEVLVQLDDTNCEPVAGWSHSSNDAINVVEVTYKRYFRVPAELDPLGQNSTGDGLSSREITVRHEQADSIALLGERVLKLKPVTLCAIGGVEGDPVSGDVANETGGMIAAARAHDAFDRFVIGGQHFAPVNAMRSDVGVVRVGQWFLGACSWWPEYSTGERGANRLVQANSVKVLDSEWYEIGLVDAGPDNVPVAAPTMAAPTQNVDGSVNWTATAIPAGVDAVVQYAVNATEPTANSALWTFFGRDSVAGTTFRTPPMPTGVTVWLRARGQKEGRYPSAWGAAVSIAITARAELYSLRLVRGTNGLIKAIWTMGPDALSVKVQAEAHAAGATPTYPTITHTVNSPTLEYEFALSETNTGQEVFSVKATPYTAAGATGTAGIPLEREIGIEFAPGVSVSPILDRDGTTLNLQPNRSSGAKSIKWAASNAGQPTAATVRGETATTLTTIAAATFAGTEGETFFVTVIPYANDDGTGVEGAPWEGSMTFHASGATADLPVVTAFPIAPTADNKEAARFVVTDDGDDVAFYYRTYNEGAVPGAFSRDPVGSSFTTDPLYHDIEVNKPAEGGTNVIIEYYAVDNDGNESKPEKIIIDGNAVPSGDFHVEVDKATSTAYLVAKSFDVTDTGSWRARVKVVTVGTTTFDDPSWSDAEATEYKGNTFGVPIELDQAVGDGNQINVSGYFLRTTSTTAATQNASRKSGNIRTFATGSGGGGVPAPPLYDIVVAKLTWNVDTTPTPDECVPQVTYSVTMPAGYTLDLAFLTIDNEDVRNTISLATGETTTSRTNYAGYGDCGYLYNKPTYTESVTVTLEITMKNSLGTVVKVMMSNPITYYYVLAVV